VSIANALAKDLNELLKIKPPFRSSGFRVAIAPSDGPKADYDPDAEHLEYYDIDASEEGEAAEKFIESRDRDRATVTNEIIVFVRRGICPAKTFKVVSEARIEYFCEEL